jgi:hypothetical protein
MAKEGKNSNMSIRGADLNSNMSIRGADLNRMASNKSAGQAEYCYYRKQTFLISG